MALVSRFYKKIVSSKDFWKTEEDLHEDLRPIGFEMKRRDVGPFFNKDFGWRDNDLPMSLATYLPLSSAEASFTIPWSFLLQIGLQTPSWHAL